MKEVVIVTGASRRYPVFACARVILRAGKH